MYDLQECTARGILKSNVFVWKFPQGTFFISLIMFYCLLNLLLTEFRKNLFHLQLSHLHLNFFFLNCSFLSAIIQDEKGHFLYFLHYLHMLPKLWWRILFHTDSFFAVCWLNHINTVFPWSSCWQFDWHLNKLHFKSEWLE